MARLSAICLAVAAFLAFAPAARAQDFFGGFCGEVTWAGQAPIDAWIMVRTENRWAAPLSVGPFTDGADGVYTQNGTMVTMRSNEGPHYTITASLNGGRLIGEVTADDGRRGVISMTQMVGAGAGVRNAPVPPDFVPEAAEIALQGDMDGLSRAVVWAWTPQGSEYWRPMRQGAGLTPEAADTLRDWMRRAAAGEQPRCDAQ